ncbi:MAG: hypothetical protein ACRC2T_01700 [Thermoguttaceae bacterium]
MHRSDSPFVVFLRSMFVIVALVSIPSIAVCWKFLPKGNEKAFVTVKRCVAFFTGKNKSEPDVEYRKDVSDDDDSETNTDINETVYPDSAHYANAGLRTNQANQAIQVNGPGVSQVIQGNNARNYNINNSNNSNISTAGYSSVKNTPKKSADFSTLETMLHNQLGATESSLETWGDEGKLYRFSCFVALPQGSGQVQKYFQAIGSDPLKLLQSVVEEVKLWRSGNSLM